MKLASLSFVIGFLPLALLALRPLLKKVPRWVSCLLWSLPGLRLLLPAAPESRVSLVPQQLTAGALNLAPIPMTHIPVPTAPEAAPAKAAPETPAKAAPEAAPAKATPADFPPSDERKAGDRA